MLCEFEGQMNCVGNKGGNSFIDVMGTQLYGEQLVFIAIMLVIVASIAIIIFDRTTPTN